MTPFRSRRAAGTSPGRSLAGPLAGALAGVLAAAVLVAAPAAAAPAPSTLAPLSASLVTQLAAATGLPMPIMVHGSTLAAADAAVVATGMTRVASFDRIGVVVARATPAQVAAARSLPGVTYLEGDGPLRTLTATSHVATRGLEARALTGANGTRLDGTGVSVAVVDTGIDPTHPSFRGADGRTRVVRNLKSLCLDESSAATDCILDLPLGVDTDTLSGGGHGTHVSGIAAGGDVRMSTGGTATGAAPGARIVSISTGAVLLIIGADAALNWILENHRAPCGTPSTTCPPIKVVNNSYGPSGGGAFDPDSATVKLQRRLAAEGVVMVWANGNDGGDGSADLSNPPGKDPTGGVISVASYHDLGTGTRDGAVSEFSSRGLATDASTWPDISAPGEDITSSCRLTLPICLTGLDPRNGPGPLDLGTFNTISGTSMAAPHIAGIVAQLFQARPDATPAQIEAALKAGAHKFTDGAPYAGGTSYDKGHGLVDVVAAVAALT
ncbi:MAG TPA: S8 family serine peptidase [Pseudonocardiaceae bacterium]